MHEGSSLSFCESLLYDHFRNNLSKLVLSDVQFLNTVKNSLTHAKTFDRHYVILFREVRNNYTAEDLRVINFLHGTTLNTYLRHVRTAKFSIRCPVALFFVETKAVGIFRIGHPQNSSLLSCDQADTVLFLRATQRYVFNADLPKW